MYNKAVIKKTDHHKSDVENKKWGARTGGLRVSGRFNPEPDLDNANVGRYFVLTDRHYPYVVLSFILRKGKQRYERIYNTDGCR